MPAAGGGRQKVGIAIDEDDAGVPPEPPRTVGQMPRERAAAPGHRDPGGPRRRPHVRDQPPIGSRRQTHVQARRRPAGLPARGKRGQLERWAAPARGGSTARGGSSYRACSLPPRTKTTKTAAPPPRPPKFTDPLCSPMPTFPYLF